MSSTPPIDRNLPRFDLDQVKSLVEELYGLEGDFRELVSERDRCWIITTSMDERSVLKISNGLEPEGVVDLQVKMIDHVLERDIDLPIPHMIPTRNGLPYEWVTSFVSGDKHMMRMTEFMQGSIVDDVPEAFQAGYYFNIGAMLGRLANALKSFFHPYSASNEHLWDLSRCQQLRPMVPELPGAEDRELCTAILDRAQDYTLPSMQRVRNQLVHQDAHGGNVMVDPANPTVPVALIDFGDMGYNSVVSEIAVAAEAIRGDEEDPLSTLIEVAKGFDSNFPLDEAEVDLLYDAFLLRLAIGTIVIGYRAIHDKEQNAHVVVDTYRVMMHRLTRLGRAEAVRRIRYALRFPVYSPIDNDDEVFAENHGELVARREKNLGKIWHFYKEPLHITRAQGGWMYTADGTAYLDAYNNVPQMGHSHPHIAKAIARQAKALNTNTRYLCDIVADYSERLTRDLPGHLDTCIFVNSGSEANDIAVQIAQSLSGNSGGIVIDNAYHGCTELSTRYSPESWLHLPKEQHPDQMECLMEPDTYNGPYAGDADAATSYAADADRAITALAERGYKPAAFIVDTAMCAHGLITPPDDYFNLVAEKTRAAGGYVIADEVQSGLGRMGSFWGYRAAGMKHENVDFITMGKPVANGHPLGVVILSSKMLDRFINGTHPLLFSTFGGNTVACAAGMAVLDVIEQENLIEKSTEIGDYLRSELRRLANKHSLIGDVRGYGILVGLEFVSCREAKTPAVEQTELIIEEMLKHKVLVGTGQPNVLKLRPSLAWNRREVDVFVSALDSSLDAIRQA